jgi:hypothetical protein
MQKVHETLSQLMARYDGEYHLSYVGKHQQGIMVQDSPGIRDDPVLKTSKITDTHTQGWPSDSSDRTPTSQMQGP